MTSTAFSRSRRHICNPENRVRHIKRQRARADRRAARRNLAGGGDGYTDIHRRTGEREVS